MDTRLDLGPAGDTGALEVSVRRLRFDEEHGQIDVKVVGTVAPDAVEVDATVLGATTSSSAISRFFIPTATSLRTPASRSVSPARFNSPSPSTDRVVFWLCLLPGSADR